MNHNCLDLDNTSFRLAYQLDNIVEYCDPKRKSIIISHGVTILALTSLSVFQLAKLIENLALTIIHGIGFNCFSENRKDFKICGKNFACNFVGFFVFPIYIMKQIMHLFVVDLNPFNCKHCWHTPESPARDLWYKTKSMPLDLLYDYFKLFNRPIVDEKKALEDILQKFSKVDSNHRNMYWTKAGHYVFFDKVHDRFWGIRIPKGEKGLLEMKDISCEHPNCEYPNIQFPESVKSKFLQHHAAIWA
ncbi:MAG: hypothetical protein K1000chlam3_01018 [Chlamydiae bacterium]|nr:hypothetical protein [Chlamydiota bacterium]